MKFFTAVMLLIAFVLVGCAGVATAPTVTPGTTLPTKASIVSADDAELAVYVATKLYEIAVTTVNKLHALGKISDDDYLAYVRGTGSVANRLRLVLGHATDAIGLWRNGAARALFDEFYPEIITLLGQLQTASKGGAH